MIPVNEQGTIVLFSKLADELGYQFHSIGTGCPDAILQKDGTKIRVEFEHKASNFRLHKHDPAAVDLIICWEDDWPTAPLPVLSLAHYVTLARPSVAKAPWWMRLFQWWRDVRTEYHDQLLAARARNMSICPICFLPMNVTCNYDTIWNDEMQGVAKWVCPRCHYTTTKQVSYDAC
jgi:hypothetical protein